MLNLSKKSERRRAQVWGTRKGPGRLLLRLAKPSHVGAFFCSTVLVVQERPSPWLLLHVSVVVLSAVT